MREENKSYTVVDNAGKPAGTSHPEYADDQDPPGENPGADKVVTGEASQDKPGDDPELLNNDGWVLQKAQEIYTTSTDYLNANITTQWERNLAHFNNQHARGSHYDKRNYKRSNTFRPKTRANIKSQEAAMASAGFSTKDLVDVTPVDPTDPVQVASAKVNKRILQHRLEKTIPWFLTVIGAYQDTKNYGICITHQYWDYHEDTDIVPAMDESGAFITEEDENGMKVAMGAEQTIIRKDQLACDNVPPENFRFDPMCDWRNPAESSPYLLALFPMYAGEVQEMMERIDPKTGQSAWRKYTMAQILSATRQDNERTKQAREGHDRVDPSDQAKGNSYTTVWAHMYIVKVNGEDMLFWTLGTNMVLTDPVPLVQAYPHLKRGQRPFTIGFSNIEAHKNYPAGDGELAGGLQQEINDVANQRLDNVKLVLNKRHFVRRGAQVDIDAMIRNVPGGGVMMNDPEKDVKIISTPDVTGSSYQEQDRLSVEMDELVGGFSQSSVQNNKSLNETVGGMGMIEQSAGAVEDYTIRIFMVTWMEPAVRQLVQLIQFYETDPVVLALAAKEAELYQRFGINRVTDELLEQELTTNINLGVGNTDPMRRVEKLIFGVTKTAELPGMIDRMKSSTVSDEIFGALGYKDGSRFFMSDQELEEFKAEQPEEGPPPEIQLKMDELEVRRADNQMRQDREMLKIEMLKELEYAKMALDRELKLEDMYTALGIAKDRDKTIRDQAALREANKSQELSIKRNQGANT